MNKSLDYLDLFFSKNKNWISFYQKNSSTKSFQRYLTQNLKAAIDGKDIRITSKIKEDLTSEIILAKQLLFKGYLTKKESIFMENWCLLLFNSARLYELDDSIVCLAETLYSLACLDSSEEFTSRSISNCIAFLIDDLLLSSDINSTNYHSNNYLEEFSK